MTDQSLMDKSLRSVFVGNIPYEATEEKLKDIFSEVGPVLSFKLVYDRETGKPKGYGFCEYKDQETALSAMRNLNGYEIGGRTLRVDNACTEKSRMEMQSLLQGPVVENPYGEAVQADKAPEAISKAVASLPPEQMFELMKQMKLCVQNNPSEARAMLLQNPQLAYALLQAQVVMRIVDPHTAVNMLHKANPIPVPLMPSEKTPTPVQAPVQQPTPVPPPAPVAAPLRDEGWTGPTPVPVPAPVQNQTPPFPAPDVDLRPVDPRLARMGDQDLRVPQGPPVTTAQAPVRDPHPRENFVAEHFPRDLRGGDPRAGELRVDHRSADPRAGDPRAVDPRAVDPRAMEARAMEARAMEARAAEARAAEARAAEARAAEARNMDPRAIDPRAMDPRAMDPRAVDPRAVDPRAGEARPVDPRAVDPRAVDPRAVDPRAVDPRAGDPRAGDPRAADPRAADPRAVDPRAERFPPRDPRERVDPRTGGPRPSQPGAPAPIGPRPGGAGATMSPITGPGASDQEKAALIMQVLQLSDEQIAMLPPEQRQSILVLKEQIAKSTQR